MFRNVFVNQGDPESDGFQLQWYPSNPNPIKPGVNPGQPNQKASNIQNLKPCGLDSWKVDEASFGECYEDLSLAKKVLQALKATRHARNVEDGTWRRGQHRSGLNMFEHHAPGTKSVKW